MFSLLNKNKFYFLSEIENGFLKIRSLSHIYNLVARKNYNNNLIISPLNDIVFKMNKFEDSFKCPNKHNVFSKIHNIFSVFKKEMGLDEKGEHIYVSSNLLFDFRNFSLRNFISLVMKSGVELMYGKGFGTFINKLSVYSTYWFSMFGYIIFGIERLNLKALGYDIENRYINLEYYLLRQTIMSGFNNIKLYLVRNGSATKRNKTLYNNVLSKIERILFFYLDKNFDDINIHFHLNKRIKTTYDIMCTVYPIFNLMFFYDKYRKDFIMFFDIIFGINHNSPSNRRKFYNSVLMNMRFNISRTEYDVKVKTFLEFYPDNTYNNIDLNITYYDKKTYKESYKKTKDYRTYRTELTYKDSFISEKDKNEVIDLLRAIDNDMNMIYKQSKIILFNDIYTTEAALFG